MHPSPGGLSDDQCSRRRISGYHRSHSIWQISRAYRAGPDLGEKFLHRDQPIQITVGSNRNSLTAPTVTALPDMVITSSPNKSLSAAAWQEQKRAHEMRVDQWIEPHRHRASRGEKHPVEDFLFTYYSFRPAWLRRWHPGPDTVLEGEPAQEFLRWSEYQKTGDGVQLEVGGIPEKRLRFVRWLREFLTATGSRPPFFGCYGWHEWAMVYRQTPEEVRHNAHPLRFDRAEIARIVENGPGCCTHFDAFRFFTDPARPLNRHQPTRESAIDLDQRGCLHANMDLYKWASKLSPYCPSDLLADCFALARDIREIDMRASPYDLAAMGYRPIEIETPTGRTEYERYQRDFAERSVSLREQLSTLCERLLT